MSLSLKSSNAVLLKFSVVCMTYFVFFRYKIARRHFCLCGDKAFPFLLPKGNYKTVRKLSNTYQGAHQKEFLKKLVQRTQAMVNASFGFLGFFRV